MKKSPPNFLLMVAYLAIALLILVVGYSMTVKTVQTATKVHWSPVAFDVTPDGKLVVAGLEGGGLILIDRASGRMVKNLTPEGFAPTDPALSPDGKYLAYSAASRDGGKCHLFLWEWQTANKARQLTTGDCDSHPSFSRDGKRIAFSRNVPYLQAKGPAVFTPCVINSDGTNLFCPTPRTFASLSRPRFSPEGRSLLFSGYESSPNSSANLKTTSGLVSVSLTSPYAVKAVDASPSGQPSGADFAFYPDISRDGKKLVFVSDGREPYVYELYVSPMPPSNSVRLHSNDVSDYIESPQFTPDGRRVLFLAAPRNTPDAGTSRGAWQLWEGDANAGKDFHLIYPRPESR